MEQMKIIATTSGGFICEIDRHEGYVIFNKTTPSIGDETDMRLVFETLASLRGMSSTQLSYMAKNIESFQKKFLEIQDAYDKLMLLDEMRSAGNHE